MNLRDQLRDILPDILPENPADSIKGTRLIQLVKVKLKQDYSDATLRYHFSIMCCDPSAPIAKVEQGQGYYLRSPMNSPQGAQNLISLQQGNFLGPDGEEEANLQLSRAMKFRALYARMNLAALRFPYLFDQDAAAAESPEILWRMPNAALVEWEVGEVDDNGNIQLDQSLLRLKQSLGLSPFTITSVKMRLDPEPKTLRREFFQCLSQSGWAHRGELVFAGPISDERVADTLRDLGIRYGVGVTSYGLDLDAIDTWPEAVTLQAMSDAEFEGFASAPRIQRLAASKSATHLDWATLQDSCRENADFADLLDWVQGCLENNVATPYHHPRSTKRASGE